MCRWAAYIGKPVFLDEIISRPGNSLVAQSQNATEAKTVTNGDGFGLAWYGERPAPGLYRDTYPAWADPNLKSVAEQVRSHLFLGHVRASTGAAISRDNCHPFVAGRWSFMHNGQIGGFDGFRKRADMLIPDALYPHRRGTTDSEVLFLLALGAGLAKDPGRALARAASTLSDLSRGHGHAPHLRLSAAFSDGTTLYAARASSDHIAPTVYYRWSDSREGWAPLELDEEDWTCLPPGMMARFDAGGVELCPLDL